MFLSEIKRYGLNILHKITRIDGDCYFHSQVKKTISLNYMRHPLREENSLFLAQVVISSRKQQKKGQLLGYIYLR